MDQSSYVMDHSIGTDMEFATINRLLADFNINHDSTFAPKRSPLKMLKITGDSLNDFGSISLNVRSEEAQTTFNTANTRIQGNIKCDFIIVRSQMCIAHIRVKTSSCNRIDSFFEAPSLV